MKPEIHVNHFLMVGLLCMMSATGCASEFASGQANSPSTEAPSNESCLSCPFGQTQGGWVPGNPAYDQNQAQIERNNDDAWQSQQQQFQQNVSQPPLQSP